MGELGLSREEGMEMEVVGMEEGGESMEVMEVVVVEEEEERENNGNGSEVANWEKMLPKMVLRVLLVEADDSTRQIISALLRKCNYKVAVASDGLKAWEILKRKHSNIDLILTELDLPSISGYALLTLIMEHDGCKNIPVIITSSQDSITMVLKCMLKGAADFLIKPVRRNELKNLWRHVWRRLSMNTHNTQNLTTGQCKVEATFENHPATNHSSDNVSSSRKKSKVCEKATDAQDLTQIKHREETDPNCKEMKHNDENIKVEKELAVNTSDMRQKATRVASEGVQPYNEANVSAASRVVENGPCTGIATEDLYPENQRLVDGHKLPEPSGEAIDLIGGIDRQNWQSSVCRGLNSVNSTPELDLSLRRYNDLEKEMDERHILSHPTASAFSRYSNNKRSYTASSVDDLTQIKEAPDTSAWPKAVNSIGENNPNVLVAASAHGEPVSTNTQSGLTQIPGVLFDGGAWTNYGPMFQPLFNPLAHPTAGSPNCSSQREGSPFLTSASLHSDPGTNISTQGCGGLGEATDHSSRQAGYEPKIRESVERHGYSNSLVVDQSASMTPCNEFPAQHKSSAHGSVSEVTDISATAHDMMGSSGVEESVKDESINTFDHDQFQSRTGHHSAEREAALAKFRLKRKGRCFEKKVRYQSRKRLAEQRPRVKGQFVRQGPTDQVLGDVDKP